ncbi:MAG: ACP S-malonyltransferase [Planctomycetota bacterium]
MAQAMVFPGQGAQYVGMGQELAAASPAAAELQQRADAILELPLSRIMREGPVEELTRTDISQPAILLASMMAHAALSERQGEPACAATGGLSLGEYTALVVAGTIGFEDALRLVRVRGEAMQAAAEATEGGMVALIGTDEGGARALCEAVRGDQVLQVANLNATGQVVISGERSACERAVAEARAHRIRRAMPLPVAGAFHCPLMASAATRLAAALEEVRFAVPRVPVYHNVTGAANTDPTVISDLLVRQLTEPVRWADCLTAMQADGADAFLELGPGKTISGMIARTLKDVSTAHVDTAADLAL